LPFNLLAYIAGKRSNLQLTTSIRKFLAFALLVVFTISIAPKSYFHDVIANHKDVVSCDHPEQSSSCLHSKAFHCHFDDLVVTTSFLFEKNLYLFILIPTNRDKEPIYVSPYSQYSFSQSVDRGPPAI